MDHSTARAARRVDQGQGAEGQLGKAAERDVLGDGHPIEEAEGLAVLGDHGDAGADGLVGMAEADRPALQKEGAFRCRRTGAVDRFEELGAAGTQQAGDAQHLAGSDRERDVAEAGPAAPRWTGQREVLDLESRPGLDRVRLVVQRGDLAADHPAHDLVGRGFRPRRRCDELAVAEHGHPVGQREDLVHLVADIQHRGPGTAQVVDDPKEPGNLRVRERRGGLIHDHD